METPDRDFKPLPERPEGNDLDDLSWAAAAYEAANNNIKVAIARALENPENPTAEVQKRAPFSQATVNKIARDMGVPKRKPGGHK
ncbi:hypothetical protein ACIRPH_31190 [Nocardiopsis sp. NPDC101807]|uniref:hypothetical protein n=1 Tax=Nocardiopsis sp. NPDC101807 TaxID=3364339 RepID=UPI003820AE6D